jgi:hypothetical protein
MTPTETEVERLTPEQKKEALAKYEAWIRQAKMDDTEDSLIEWDRIENHKQLLDWDTDRNIQRGLWIQAHNILASRRHHILANVSGPDVWKNEDSVYVPVNKMSAKDLNFLLQNWLTEIRGSYIRLRDAGAKYPNIKNAAIVTIEAAEKEFKKTKS